MIQNNLKDNNIENDESSQLIVANAIHEIRTPVQTIIGLLDLLSETELSKKQEEYLRHIKSSSNLLLSLSNDILDFAKLRSKTLSIEKVPFDAKSLVESVTTLISIEAFSKSLEVEFSIDYSLPDLFFGDPTRITQILMNILKNAVKFTKRGYIYSELQSIEKENGMFLLFKVTDSGIGVDDKKHENLFKKFYQGDDVSFSRHYGGTGLGLALCRLLVARMGGEIGFYPNKFGGSVFWFTIPFEAALEENDVQDEIPFPENTKVLIAAKNTLVANSLSKKLAFLGLNNSLRTEAADETFLAMHYASKIGEPFSFVFIEEEMDGVENLAKEIHDSPMFSAINIYLLEKNGFEKQFEIKKEELFTDVLQKPVALKKISSILIDANPQEKAKALIEKQKRTEAEKQKQEFLKKQDRELAKGIKILVAEDHPVNRRILIEFLKRFGAETFECENGEEALEMQNLHPDIQIIFMDIKMPVLSGLETTIELRKRLFTGVIIACSANTLKNDFAQYEKAGINDILHKPFQRNTVRQILEKWKSVLLMPIESQGIFIESKTTRNDKLWDIPDFEDTIGGNWNVGVQVLLDYIDQTRILIDDGRKAIFEKNFTRLDTIAHTLKGSSAAISANRLFKIAETLNQAVKNKTIDDVENALSYFEKMFDVFILEAGKVQGKIKPQSQEGKK